MPDVLQKYCQRTGTGVLFEEDNYGFSLGLERGGHSGGYCYKATTEDKKRGCTVRGEIVYLPETEAPKKTGRAKAKAIFFTVLLSVPLAVLFVLVGAVWLLALLGNCFVDLFTGRRRNRVKRQLRMAFPPKKERVLRDIMGELGCKELETDA